MNTPLPLDFIENIKNIIGNETDVFTASLNTTSPISIRYNPQKAAPEEKLKQVAWCPNGFYLNERPKFTLDPLLHAGGYYVQEAGSMFLYHLFEEGVFPLLGRDIKVLDMCAAPGGKSTLIASMLGNEGLLVSNEVIRSRASILEENIVKWGTGRGVVTSSDPSDFTRTSGFFDCIVVDAPCSGEGMFRKDEEARREWSLDSVEMCAVRQRRILADSWEALAPGGVMIYSTCTFNSKENEENIEWLYREFDCETININTEGLEGFEGIVRSYPEGINCFRFYPHKLDTEGFFAAIIRKSPATAITGNGGGYSSKLRKSPISDVAKNDCQILKEHISDGDFVFRGDLIYNIAPNQRNNIEILLSSVNVRYFGVEMGQIFKGKLKPSHPLAVCRRLNLDSFRNVELSLDEALDFLRKGTQFVEEYNEGINLVCYKSTPLGFVKAIGRRVNNLYPKEYRILQL